MAMDAFADAFAKLPSAIERLAKALAEYPKAVLAFWVASV